MKRAVVIFFMIVVSLAAEQNAYADGYRLLRQCQQAIEYVEDQSADVNIGDAMYCAGYLNGILATANLARNMHTEVMICQPSDGVSTEQAARIVVKYLQENPADLQLDESVSAVIALAEAFPCDSAETD